MRRANIVRQDVLSLSFLDLVTCGLGATVLLFFAVVFSIGISDSGAGAASGRQQQGVFGPAVGTDPGADKGTPIAALVSTEVRVEGRAEAGSATWAHMPTRATAYTLFSGAAAEQWTNFIVISNGTPVGLQMFLPPSFGGRSIQSRLCFGPVCSRWKPTRPILYGNQLLVFEVGQKDGLS